MISLLVDGRVNSDLSHMRIAAVLMIGDHSDLNHKCADGILSDVFNWYDNPAGRFAEIDDFDFIQIVEVSSATYRNS